MSGAATCVIVESSRSITAAAITTANANRSSELFDTFFALVRGLLRPGIVRHDLSLAFELVAAIKFSSPERTTELRHRYLAVILDGLRAKTADANREDLPGPPPAWPELTERWVPLT